MFLNITGTDRPVVVVKQLKFDSWCGSA